MDDGEHISLTIPRPIFGAMAKTISLQNNFSGGMRRDVPRNQMPKGTVWNLVDFLPDWQGVPLLRRGGYQVATPSLSTVRAGTTSVPTVVYAPFAAAGQLCGVDEDNEFWRFVSSSSAVDVAGASVQPSQRPVFHRQLLIMTHNGGNATPSKYDGTNVTAVSGSPPQGAYATVYKDRTVLGFTTANRERIWFSAGGDPQTWDTTNRYIDTSGTLTGLASLPNALICFHQSFVERIRGSVPPPGSDMVLEPLSNETGCIDARSIALWGERLIYADIRGIYVTDGAIVRDLTEIVGAKEYWQELLQPYGGSYVLSGIVWGRFYIICVTSSTSTAVDTLVFDLHKDIWFRWSNIRAAMFTIDPTLNACYFGDRGFPRVWDMRNVLDPVSATFGTRYVDDNYLSGEAAAMTPIIETPYFGEQPLGKKRFRNIYLRYDLRSPGGGSPTFSLGYVTNPDSTAYTTISTDVSSTTAFSQKKFPIKILARGMAFSLSGSTSNSSNAMNETRIYSLDIEAHAKEQSA